MGNATWRPRSERDREPPIFEQQCRYHHYVWNGQQQLVLYARDTRRLCGENICAPSDSGISKLRHLRAVPNVIVASAAGLEMAITLSKEYASVFGEVPKIAVFECEVVTEVTVPETDTRPGTQDMIHFVSYTSKGPKNIRTMGNHLSVAIPCQPNEIINFKGNCVRIVVRALAGFICSRSPRQPE